MYQLKQLVKMLKMPHSFSSAGLSTVAESRTYSPLRRTCRCTISSAAAGELLCACPQGLCMQVFKLPVLTTFPRERVYDSHVFISTRRLHHTRRFPLPLVLTCPGVQVCTEAAVYFRVLSLESLQLLLVLEPVQMSVFLVFPWV